MSTRVHIVFRCERWWGQAWLIQQHGFKDKKGSSQIFQWMSKLSPTSCWMLPSTGGEHRFHTKDTRVSNEAQGIVVLLVPKVSDGRMTGIVQWQELLLVWDLCSIHLCHRMAPHPASTSFHAELEFETTALADFFLLTFPLQHRCRPRRRWNVTAWSVNCGVALGLCGTRPMSLCAWRVEGGCEVHS